MKQIQLLFKAQRPKIAQGGAAKMRPAPKKPQLARAMPPKFGSQSISVDFLGNQAEKM